MIPVASQPRLMGGLGDHEVPWKRKYRAHRKIKHAPALRSPNHSLPTTAFPTGGRRGSSAPERASARLARLMDNALSALSRLRCACYLAEDAGIYSVRTEECAAHRGLA
jgi:hypothetical protein